MGGTGAAPKITGNRIPIVPDGGWGWMVVLGSFLIHVIADGFVYSFGILVDVLQKEFKTDNAAAALIIALLTGLTLGSGPIASAITNKFGCRIASIIGSCIASVGCLASYFATSMGFITFTVGIVMGIGFGLMYCPAIVIVTMYFEKRRALATGITVCGAGVGSALFGPINERVIKYFGWRAVFLSFTGVILFCTLCGATFRPLQFISADEKDEEDEEGEEKKGDETEHTKEDAALLTPNDPRIRTHSSSSSQIDRTGTNSAKGSKLSLRAANSMGQVNGDGLRGRSRSGTVTSSTGYLQKKDVFYMGSIHNVSEFKENPDKVRSITSIHQAVTEEMASRDENILEVISRMLNLSLLTEVPFLLFAISNLMTSVGFNSPLYFLPIHGEKGLGLTSTDAALAITTFGITNTAGRLVFGLIGDRELPLPYGWGKDPARNRLWIYNLSLTFCGILTACSYFFNGFIQLCVYAGLFGFSISSYVCLTSVILVDLLGLEKLTNAFGLLLLFQGIGTVFGPPISGYLADLTGSYHPAFVFCGINLAVSGLMLFTIPFLNKRKENQQQKEQGVKPLVDHGKLTNLDL
ncbi:unnamed protein product, partial [Mesorhabditis belari]|uniref:Major facilitator superfamily (MFS) profile domain-containing protein n=1 Tax=Mesorhabditis belari TaxID=2138241 RepID=A0AAF3FMP1_9BILA